MNTLKSRVKEYARELGFDLVGIASSESFADHESIALERLRGGLMDGLPWYTESRVHRGCNPEEILPGARSIIAVGMSYHVPGEEDEGTTGREHLQGSPGMAGWPNIAGVTTTTWS